jgi:hypothetical protein
MLSSLRGEASGQAGSLTEKDMTSFCINVIYFTQIINSNIYESIIYFQLIYPYKRKVRGHGVVLGGIITEVMLFL